MKYFVKKLFKAIIIMLSITTITACEEQKDMSDLPANSCSEIKPIKLTPLFLGTPTPEYPSFEPMTDKKL